MRLKNSAEAAKLRLESLSQQGGLDAILGIQITAPVLDHQHFPPFHCRQVLQSEVNIFEGKVFNCYKRYLSHLTDKPLVEVLKLLITYLEQDYSRSPIHYTGINDEIKPFKRLNAQGQEKILAELNILPAKNASKRIRQFKKAMLADKISYNELLQKVETLKIDSNQHVKHDTGADWEADTYSRNWLLEFKRFSDMLKLERN